MLWMAVLVSAVKQIDGPNEAERKEGKNYVFSNSMAPTSFRWVCSVLGIDANTFQTSCISRSFRREFCKHKFIRGD